MVTLEEIRKETPIDQVTSPMNRGVLLDTRLFNSMLRDDISYGRKSYDFDVYLDTYGKNLQRPYVWLLWQQRDFIKNILLEKTVEPVVIVLHELENTNEIIYVIDGKQRLLTIHKFLHNEFSIMINGKDVYWSDLDDSAKMFFRSRINNFTANVYYSYYDKPMSDREKIILFNYYNFSGTPQTEEHKKMLQGLLNKEL